MLNFKNSIIYFSLILIMSSGKCGKTENQPNTQPDNDPTPTANPPAQTKLSMFKSLVLGNSDFKGSVKKDDFEDEKDCKEFFDIIELIKKVTNIPASENGIESILGNSKMFDSSKKLTKGNLGPLKNVFESVRPGELDQSTVATLNFESIKTLNDALGNTSKADTFNDKGFFNTTTIGYIEKLYNQSSDSIKNLLPKLDIFTKTQVEYLQNANEDDLNALKALNDLDTALAKSLCKAIAAAKKELTENDLKNLCKIAEVVEFDGKGLEDALKEVVDKDSDYIKAIYNFVIKLKSANSKKLTLYDYYTKKIFEEFTKKADDKVYLRELFNEKYFQELKDNIKTIKNANEDDLVALNDLDTTLAKPLCEAIAAAKEELTENDLKKLCEIAKVVEFNASTLKEGLENVIKQKAIEYLHKLVVELKPADTNKLKLYKKDYKKAIFEKILQFTTTKEPTLNLINNQKFQELLATKADNIMKADTSDIATLSNLTSNPDDLENVVAALNEYKLKTDNELFNLIIIRKKVKNENNSIDLVNNVINLQQTKKNSSTKSNEAIEQYAALITTLKINKGETITLKEFYKSIADVTAVNKYLGKKDDTIEAFKKYKDITDIDFITNKTTKSNKTFKTFNKLPLGNQETILEQVKKNPKTVNFTALVDVADKAAKSKTKPKT